MRSYKLKKSTGKDPYTLLKMDSKGCFVCSILWKMDKGRKGACVCFCLLVRLSVNVDLCVGLSVSTYVCLSVSLRVSALSPIYVSMYLSVVSFSLCLSVCLHRDCIFLECRIEELHVEDTTAAYSSVSSHFKPSYNFDVRTPLPPHDA